MKQERWGQKVRLQPKHLIRTINMWLWQYIIDCKGKYDHFSYNNTPWSCFVFSLFIKPWLTHFYELSVSIPKIENNIKLTTSKSCCKAVTFKLYSLEPRGFLKFPSRNSCWRMEGKKREGGRWVGRVQPTCPLTSLQ